jgi:hypothetical protein
MKRFKRGFVALGLTSLIALAVGSTATTAVAVPDHRHCMLTPRGYVEVGPRVFKTAPHEPAFHNFHNHVHVSAVPTTIVAIFDPAVPCSSLNG